MYIKFLLLIVLIVMSFSGCKKSTEPIGNDKPPPGYQEDIPWPSLADSPWPRDHGDAQSTGRSKYPGPITGSVEWSIDTVSLNCGVSLGEDSSIYFSTGNYDGSRSGLYKVSLDGEVKWFFDTGHVYFNRTTPLITSDGTIVASNGVGGTMFAINSDGSQKWKYEINERIQQRGINIDKHGTIFVIDVKMTIYAISQNGYLLWSLSLESGVDKFGTLGTSFSPDGKLLYIRGYSKSIIAVDINNQSINWTFGDREKSGGATPVVSSDGSVYILGIPLLGDGAKSSITSLNQSGEVLWRYFFDGARDIVSYYAPTIDKNGNIYFAGDSLYSLTYNGELRWKKSIPSGSLGALVCDSFDNVFIPVYLAYKNQVLGYDSDGNQFFETALLVGTCGESMALGENYLVVPTYYSQNIYLIRN